MLFRINKKLLINICKWLIVICALYFLGKKGLLNWQILLTFRDHPILFAFILLSIAVTIYLSSIRWLILLKAQAFYFNVIDTLKPTYIGQAYNHIIPGGVGGDVVRLLYMLKYVPNKKSALVLSILADRLTGLFGAVIVIVISGLFKLSSISHASSLIFLFKLSLGAIITLFLAVFISILLPERVGLSHLLENKFQHYKITRPLLSLLEAFRVYRQNKMSFFTSLGLSVLIQYCFTSTMYLIGLSLGFSELGFVDYCFATMITQIANLLPLTPGGIGIGEIAFAQTLSMLNNHEIAPYASISLACRLIYILASLPGVLLYLHTSNRLAAKELASS